MFRMKQYRELASLLAIPIVSTVLSALFLLWQPLLAAPTQAPVNGNPAAPINNGSTAQTRTGPLTVTNTVTATNASVAGNTTTSGSVCVSGSCLNYWPSASYSAPGIDQVLNAGNSSSSTLSFSPGYGFSFNNGYSNSGFRSTWPSPYIYRPYAYTKIIGYTTWTFCDGNDFMCGIQNLGGPYGSSPAIYCCPVSLAN